MSSFDVRSLIWYDDSRLDVPVAYYDSVADMEKEVGELKGELILKYFPLQSIVMTEEGCAIICDLNKTTGECNIIYSNNFSEKRAVKLNWTALRRLRIMPISSI